MSEFAEDLSVKLSLTVGVNSFPLRGRAMYYPEPYNAITGAMGKYYNFLILRGNEDIISIKMDDLFGKDFPVEEKVVLPGEGTEL